MVYCIHCGASLESEARFCSQCGKKLEGESPPLETAKKKAPFWFKALIFIAFFIIGALILNALLIEDLTDTVENQLKAVKNQQLTEAYYAFTSKKFQESTSMEAFSTFIKTHPAFSTNQAIHFKERNVNNDIGTLDAVLTTKKNQKIQVEYKLIKEADQWKILSIRIEDPPPAMKALQSLKKSSQSASHGTLTFSHFVLGNTLLPTGLVQTASNIFDSHSGDIYLNLYVTDAKENTKVKLIFEHLDTKTTLNPVTTRTTRAGDEILSFVFSPPESGWPQGNYRLKAISGDIHRSFDFAIE
jgi:hypothetical protein